MSYYSKLVTSSTDPDVKLGRAIYMKALGDRRGFADRQLDNIDADIWLEILKALGKTARQEVVKKEHKLSAAPEPKEVPTYTALYFNTNDELTKGTFIGNDHNDVLLQLVEKESKAVEIIAIWIGDIPDPIWMG